jgi:NDP-sugar pyrophosphorylase family protein
MCAREYDFQVPYGVIETSGDKITAIEEKPVHKFFVNAGIYVIEQALVKCVDGKSYIDMPQFIEGKIKEGASVNVFPVHEYWLDIGRMEEYERANQEFLDISYL